MLGYVGKKADGGYAPFHWNTSLLSQDVEISDDVFLIQREVAEAYAVGKVVQPGGIVGGTSVPATSLPGGAGGVTQPIGSPTTDRPADASTNISRLVWSGDVPHQKWMNFYTKVLSKFAGATGLKLTLRVEVAPAEGASPQKVDET